jgi:hypothetical protein
VWGGLHGFGLAITRYFQRNVTGEGRVVMFGVCAGLAVLGAGTLWFGTAFEAGTWTLLVIAWLTLTPLWAVLTAWLGRDPDRPAPEPVEPPIADGWPFRALFLRNERTAATIRPPVITVELLRIAMCLTGVGFLLALAYWETWTWIPIVLVMWGFAFAADVVERGTHDLDARIATMVQRAVAAVLVFHYVCLAWVFFRATSFDNALGVLRQLGAGELDSANLVPIVTISLVTGFVCHFFAEGSFRWLRRRFVALPAPLMGLVLAIVALVLRELSHHEVVPFIYFQF